MYAGLQSSFLKADAAKAQAAGENVADQAQADRLERAAQYGKAAASEYDAQSLENLNVTLGNLDAVRAAASTDPSSPTGAALRDRTEYIADRSRTTQVSNIMAQAAQNEADANYMRSAGAYALKVGDISAKAIKLQGYADLGSKLAKTVVPGG